MKDRITIFAPLERWAVAALTRRRRRWPVNELAVLSDRTSKDMGLHRSQIRALAEEVDRQGGSWRTGHRPSASVERRHLRWRR